MAHTLEIQELSELPLRLFVPVDRGKAVSRGVLWALTCSLLAWITLAIYGRLDFTPSGVSNRLTDWSIALVALPVPLLGIISLVRAVRWLLLSCWPKAGILATESTLALRFGPFGTRSFAATSLDILYPFEWPEDQKEGNVEAFLPEEQQVQQFLPRITHPNLRDPLNVLMLRFVRLSESELAGRLRPAIERWRQR